MDYFAPNWFEIRLQNAVSYTHLSGRDGFLFLTVTDDGPGYPASVLQKGPAFFLRDDTSGNGHLGVGLAVCRLLCEKHGGSLTLENLQPGAKATAVFKSRNS